ncbi:hypothetical protein [Escherichia coli]|uniref:hypothetical protein n=1 Tax=Escherichia coli TaxID=562 RepID=UPI001EE1AADF|nr:hypothetical protein [Escherichia coli]GJI35422.1 hypothetical protein ECZC18_54440 [Escherichia coli]
MITQQIISSELEVLKKHIDSGDVNIPPLLQVIKARVYNHGMDDFLSLTNVISNNTKDK